MAALSLQIFCKTISSIVHYYVFKVINTEYLTFGPFLDKILAVRAAPLVNMVAIVIFREADDKDKAFQILRLFSKCSVLALVLFLNLDLCQ